MSARWFVIIAVLLTGVLLNGCSGGRQAIPATPEMDTHPHSSMQTRTFGDRHYHATMRYESRYGIISVEFSDEHEYPLKIVRAERVKAVLSAEGGQQYEFYFHNPMHQRYHAGSYRVAGEMYPPTDNVHTQGDRFKNLKAFTLKVWIPLHGETYIVEFVYLS